MIAEKYNLLWVILVVVVSGCYAEKATDPAAVATTQLRLPSVLQQMSSTRQVEASDLFAEVSLRYSDETLSATAAPPSNLDVWVVELTLPAGEEFMIEVVWYDTTDDERVDLVRFNRNFAARFESGPITFDFDDYDFDGFDNDGDGITNLAERQAGTLPTEIGPDLGCPVIPAAQSNVNGEPIVGYQNPVLFTDDFDNGLPRYVGRFFGSADAESSLILDNGSATLLVDSEDADGGAASIDPVLVNDPDSIFVRVQVPPESTAVSVDGSGADSRFRIVGSFFNSLNAGGPTDASVNSRAGDVILTLSLRNFQQGRSDFLYCAQVVGDDGSRGFFVDLTEDGDGDGCALIDTLPVDLEFGREYLLGVGVDRDAGTLYFQVDDTRVDALIPGPVLRASSPELFAGVAARGANVLSVATISEISVNGNIDTQLIDLNADILGRYSDLKAINSRPNETIVATGGQVELRGLSTGTGSTFTGLVINGNTDFIAADLALSADTRIENNASNATVRIGGSVYNDLSNGGVDGSNEGDVRATLEILSNADGSISASACLIRFQADDQSDVCSVIAPNAFCVPFNTAVQIGTSYRTSIAMDRQNRRVVFRLDDEEIIHNIQTNSFLPASAEKSVSTRMRGDGMVVGVTDNLATINATVADGVQ